MIDVTALPPPIERFLGELAADPWFCDVADQFRRAFEATERSADDCFHHQQFSQTIALICAQSSRPLRDRIADIAQIVDAPRGKIVVTIRRSA
jgi:hypothetical protein